MFSDPANWWLVKIARDSHRRSLQQDASAAATRDDQFDVELMLAIQTFGTLIRSALNPYDAKAHSLNLLAYLNRRCLHYFRSDLTSVMRQSVEDHVIDTLAAISRDWSKEQRDQVKIGAFGWLADFFAKHRAVIEHCEADVPLGRFKWQPPLPREQRVAPCVGIAAPKETPSESGMALIVA